MAANPLKYRLKYVGGPTIESVRYLHIKDGTNDRTFYTETVAEIEAMTFISNGNAQDIVIESVPLFVAEIITNPTINSVTGVHIEITGLIGNLILVLEIITEVHQYLM